MLLVSNVRPCGTNLRRKYRVYINYTQVYDFKDK
jgi:hypothetical protein